MAVTIVSVSNRFLKLKRMLRGARNRLFPGIGVSSNYVLLDGKEADAEGQRLRNSWQDVALPKKIGRAHV